MKKIRYKVTVDGPRGARSEIVEIFARSITTGFSKAVSRAKALVLPHENLHSVEFWEVR